MFGNFWKKRAGTGEPSQEKAAKLPGPRDIPEPVGRHLVVQLGKNPDWVWNLKSVVRRRQEGKDSYDVRVFDRAQVAEQKVSVQDYTSLDEHPELILFEGWFDKKSMEVHTEEKEKSVEVHTEDKQGPEIAPHVA